MLKFSMTTCTIAGRIGFIDHKIISEKFSILKMSVAVDNRVKIQGTEKEYENKTMWFNCEYPNPLPWVIANVGKGSQVILNGEIIIDTVEKDGKKNNYTHIKVKELMPCKGGEMSEQTDSSAPAVDGKAFDSKDFDSDLPF